MSIIKLSYQHYDLRPHSPKTALAMVRRSDPVPQPPPQVADEGLNFTLPVIFRARANPRTIVIARSVGDEAIQFCFGDVWIASLRSQ
jgi:hypothetical protein